MLYIDQEGDYIMYCVCIDDYSPYISTSAATPYKRCVLHKAVRDRYVSMIYQAPRPYDYGCPDGLSLQAVGSAEGVFAFNR